MGVNSIRADKLWAIVPRILNRKTFPFWTVSGFSIRIGVGSKTSGVGGEGIARAKGMTLWWVYRSVPHLGDSYNLDL